MCKRHPEPRLDPAVRAQVEAPGWPERRDNYLAFVCMAARYAAAMPRPTYLAQPERPMGAPVDAASEAFMRSPAFTLPLAVGRRAYALADASARLGRARPAARPLARGRANRLDSTG